jgi:hypothetical protein
MLRHHQYVKRQSSALWLRPVNHYNNMSLRPGIPQHENATFLIRVQYPLKPLRTELWPSFHMCTMSRVAQCLFHPCYSRLLAFTGHTRTSRAANRGTRRPRMAFTAQSEVALVPAVKGISTHCVRVFATPHFSSHRPARPAQSTRTTINH